DIRFRLDATSAKKEGAVGKRERRNKGRRQHRLRVMRTHDQSRTRFERRTGYLQHLRVVQTDAPPKPRLNRLTLLVQSEWLSAHAIDSPPDQKSFAHAVRKSSHRSLVRDAPVNNASPERRASPTSQLSH